jgi:hypothetical protein
MHDSMRLPIELGLPISLNSVIWLIGVYGVIPHESIFQPSTIFKAQSFRRRSIRLPPLYRTAPRSPRLGQRAGAHRRACTLGSGRDGRAQLYLPLPWYLFLA